MLTAVIAVLVIQVLGARWVKVTLWDHISNCAFSPPLEVKVVVKVHPFTSESSSLALCIVV